MVPVDSERAAGAVVKKGMRTLLLWYVGWITHQVSQFASAVSRTLHIVEGRLKELERKVEVQRVPGAGVVEVPPLHGAEAWWVAAALEAVQSVPGRILHAASGDGWLVQPDHRRRRRRLRRRSADQSRRAGRAYGVRSPGRRPGRPSAVRGPGRPRGHRAERCGRRHGERRARPAPPPRSPVTLAPGGVLVRALAQPRRRGTAPTRPTRPISRPGGPCGPTPGASSSMQSGYHATVASGPGDADYLVTAVRATVPPPEPTPGAVSAAGPQGPPVAVHQFVPTLNPHDATGTHTLLLRDILRRAGWRSEIFAEAIHDDLAAEAYKHWMYPDHARPGDVLIYQFSTSSAVAGFLAARAEPLIVDFHNFTGTRALRRVGTAYRGAGRPGARRVGPVGASGRSWAWPTATSTSATCAEPGYRRTAVLPVLVDYGRVGTGSRRPMPGWRPSSRAPKDGGGDRHPLRRAHRPVKGASTNWSRPCGPTAGSTIRRRACIWWGGRRASPISRPCAASSTSWAWPTPCGSPGRCPTAALAAYFDGRRRLPLALGPRGFRGTADRGDGGRCPGRGPRHRRGGRNGRSMPPSSLPAGDPSFVAAAVQRVCTDGDAAATVDRGGPPARGRRSRLDAVGPTVVAAVATVAGAPR